MNTSGKEAVIFSLLMAVNGALMIALWYLADLDRAMLINRGDLAKALSGVALLLTILEKLLIDKLRGK